MKWILLISLFFSANVFAVTQHGSAEAAFSAATADVVALQSVNNKAFIIFERGDMFTVKYSYDNGLNYNTYEQHWFTSGEKVPECDVYVDAFTCEDKPELPYCSTDAAVDAMTSADAACVAGIPDGMVIDKNEWFCKDNATEIDGICSYKPDDTTEPPVDPEIPDPEIPDGGGTGGSGEDGGSDGGGGGGESPSTDFCKENPKLCAPVERPECVEQPWLCDVPPEPDDNILDDISKITQLLQTNNTIADSNNKNNADSNNSLKSVVNNQVKQLDKQETIKDNTKVIADNTDLATDYLKSIDNKTKVLNDDLNKQISESNKLLDLIAKKKIPSPLPTDLSGVEGKLDNILTETSKSFCTKNPSHESCVKETLSISGCESFSCTLGDKLKCASLELQWKSYCESSKIDWDKELGDPIKSWADKFDQTSLVNKNELDYSNPDLKYLNGSGLTLSGTCPAPQKISINIAGFNVGFSLSYEFLCKIADILSPLIKALASIISVFVVGRGLSTI